MSHTTNRNTANRGTATTTYLMRERNMMIRAGRENLVGQMK